MLYAFDFYYELYLDQIENYGADYEEKDIPKLIIENNLHGIDLDDRAIQLAQLGLFIKAKKKRRTVGELNFRVVSSDFYLPEYNEVRHIFEQDTGIERNQHELIEKIWNDLQYAYKFGSLVQINEQLKKQLYAIEERAEDDLFAKAELSEHQDFAASFFSNLEKAVERYARTGTNTFLTSKTRDAITFLELLTTEYDVATANPPYTDSSDFGPDLKEFIEDNYKKPYKFHTNLYATFIKRCYEFTGKDGKIAMIHPHTFMFIKTFEGVRKYMMDKCHIDVMVDFGLDRVNLFGPGILLDATFYVLSKGQADKDGLYFNLTTSLQEKFKKGKFLNALDDYISGVPNERIYTLEQSKLKIIKSWPFIYWISDDFREKFKSKSFEDYFKLATGLMTGNNLKHLRYYWEVDPKHLSSDYHVDKKRWVPYQKGGDFKKWYGNNWLVVDFEGSGERLATTDNKTFYFNEGITYSATSTKGVSFRKLPSNQVFDKKGSCIFSSPDKEIWDLDYVLAVLNSKLASYVVNCLNSTVETQVGDIKRVPFLEPSPVVKEHISSLSRTNISLRKNQNEFLLLEKEFQKSPLFSAIDSGDFRKAILGYLSFDNFVCAQILINEAIIDQAMFELYSLADSDIKTVLEVEGQSVGSLPLDPAAKASFIQKLSKDTIGNYDYTKNFIEKLLTREFSIDEIENIKSNFTTLYQKNNDVDSFCIKNQINPINLWYWFEQSQIIPTQRMKDLSMEFLTDIVREVLIQDEDGIVPLVPNAGEKILIDRIEAKFEEKGFTTALYSSFEAVLGKPLKAYIFNTFFREFSDHLNLFPNIAKTPFIWHLTSGPEQGFDCYIIIYKWSRDNLLRLRSVYIENRERALINRQSDLSGNESADAQAEKERIFKQLKEIESFKKKIDELLAEGYDPILDDGVGKNIAPLQQKKMLAYDVLNEGQLKKYLNADW